MYIAASCPEAAAPPVGSGVEPATRAIRPMGRLVFFDNRWTRPGGEWGTPGPGFVSGDQVLQSAGPKGV